MGAVKKITNDINQLGKKVDPTKTTKTEKAEAVKVESSQGTFDTMNQDINARNAGLGAAIQASQDARSKQATPQMKATNIDRSKIQNVQGQNVGPGQAVMMDTSGVQRVAAGTATPAQQILMDQAKQNQMREQQMSMGEYLAAQAKGTAPSVAALQAQRQGERALAAQLAMSAGQTGALASRSAAFNQASIGADIANQSAIARLQEQQDAQKNFADFATGVRGQDITVASTQAGLDRDVSLANLQANVADMDRQLRADLANQGVDLDKAKADAAAGNQMALANLQVATQNADRQLKAAMANQGVDLDVLKANAAAGNAAAMANLQAELTKMGLDDAMTRAYLQNQLDLNAQQTNTLLQQASILSQEAMANAANQTNVNVSNATGVNTARTADANRRSEILGGLVGAGGTAGAAAIAASDEKLKKNINKDDDEKKKRQAFADAVKSAGESIAAGFSSKKSDSKPTSGMSDGISKIGDALAAKYGKKKEDDEDTMDASDENNKKNKSKDSGRLGEFLNNLDVYSYDYKDEKFGKGRQTSIMAQDLEKSEIGKKAVIDTPEGKMVDYSKLFPAMLAANVDANKRIMTLEEALRAKKDKK